MKEDERPREKMLRLGPGNVSDAELLAILLRTGKGSLNVLELSNRIMAECGGVPALASLTTDELLLKYAGLGIGEAKAIMLSAAFELGRRSMVCHDNADTPITDASQIYSRMGARLGALDHEECWVLYLNRSNIIISEEMLTKGSIDSTVVDAKAIVKRALDKKKATAVILVHNHPSGNPAPGRSDVKVTKELRDALSFFDISLYDHVVISHGRYFSFEKGKVVKV